MSDAPQGNQSSVQNTFSAEVYVQQTAQLLNLSIPPEQMAGVVENFERIQAIAQPVLEFPLPDTLEAAPRFEP
ncbi:MAG: DUF4089 domain-containing protein [Leptolyngbyaceae cyanobacterium MO_188.B28]|nr:DUF4089 domain-containing protein [Leptolyngbyaceae cyanobacterium MO_188.B28]